MTRGLAVIVAVAVVLAVGVYLTAHGGGTGDEAARLHGPVPGPTTTPGPTPDPAANFAVQQVRAARKLHCIQRAGSNARKHARCERLP